MDSPMTLNLPTILQDDDSYEILRGLPPGFADERRKVIAAMVKLADDAVAAERERCAKITEQMGYDHDIEHVGVLIAAKIREVK